MVVMCNNVINVVLYISGGVGAEECESCDESGGGWAVSVLVAA